MLLSTKITYSVRSLAYIANYVSGQRPIPLSEIAEVEGISLHYLEQLFNKLRRGGIVNSVRGPKGGFLLARPATAISIDDIIQVLGIEVFSNLAEGDDAEAPSDRSCIHGTGRRPRPEGWLPPGATGHRDLDRRHHPGARDRGLLQPRRGRWHGGAE